MATQAHQSSHGKDYLDMPSTDPTRQDKPTEEALSPEEAANTGSRLEQTDTDLGSDAVGLEGDDYAGRGDLPREPGTADLQDAPPNSNSRALDDLQGRAKLGDDVPVFDRSVENRNTDLADMDEPISDDDEEPAVGKDDLSEEDRRVYDVSIDGPGTSDLR